METCKDRIAETERVRERKRVQVGAKCSGCAWGTRKQRWWAGGGSTCGRIWRLHHRETSTKRKEWEASGSTEEDQKQQLKNNRTNWGREYDLSKKLLNASASSDPFVALEYLAEWWDIKSARVRNCAEVRSCGWRRTKFCIGSILRDGWTKESLHRREVLERYRGEDAGDVRRSESNELIENWACLIALKSKIWNINPKIFDGWE